MIIAEEDKCSIYGFKADEANLVGDEKGPLEAYLLIDGVLEVAHAAGVVAIDPGHGFLSECPEFVGACVAAGRIMSVFKIALGCAAELAGR